MAIDTNFNVNPYYDDYDEDKKFLRMLFKPGYAVQARELTQLQTILQKQVERFGNHIFKNGSVVSGGQTVFQNTNFLKIETNYSGSAVTIDDFVGKTIVDNIQIPTKRAEVIRVYDADVGTGDPKTLMIQPIFGTFNSGDTILTYETGPTYANVATSGTGQGQTFSVDEGVYYYDGFFLKNDAQTIAVSKYSLQANARIGFEITESIVEPTEDTSLLDPALNASNYQAPGADRFKILLTLATRSIDSTDDTEFIELARVENGYLTKYYKYPIYSVLEDTLARRTYDESGNYTVKPFKLALQTNSSNTANLDVILSPGKAYVFGYEFETISPTTITFDKPRETDSVTNKRLSADYGYFVYANNFFGSFPINSLQTVDLHCVANASINVNSTGTVSNTKIGTARIKSIAYDSAANSANSATYEYKLFLFDINVGSITGGNCNTGIAAGNTSYVQIANTVSGSLFYSTVDNAYQGAKFRIVAGPGVGEEPRTILNYKGSTQTIQLDTPFTANINTQSQFAIDFEFNDAKSIIVSSTNSIKTAADIDERSKDPATTFNDTVASDTSSEELVFSLGDSFVANGSIADISLSYRRLYENQIFAAGLSPALTVGTGESIASAGSTSARAENYQIVVTSQGSGVYGVGQTVPATAITGVDVSTRRITVTGGGSMTANIIATIDVSNPTQKNKTFVAGNTTIQTTGGLDLFGNGAINLFGTQGQIHIAANTIIKTPDTPQSIFTSDVTGLISVLDFNGLAISPANEGSAINVSSRYVLVNGQKDSYYDHASIKLKPGVAAPAGPLVVKFNHFISSGAGFFTVDSYTVGGFPYENIPAYTATNGTVYELRDSLDFRPVRANATVATANSFVFDVDSSTTGPKIPENGSDIILDFDFHLARNDKIILNKNKTFEVLQGVSSLNPIDPKDKDNAMTLYILRHPPYVLNSANTSVQYINNKRYTMRDIGTIEKRVENLEYYTSLSLLEQETLGKQDLTILDTTNLSRFKNGIIVDSFKGHSIADVTRNEYKAAIDPNDKEMRPTFNIAAYALNFDSANSSGYTQNGAFVTISSAVTQFIDQPKASKVVNVNPFNVVNYLGKIELNPKSDIWIDTARNPDVLVNLEGDRDAWALITDRIPAQFEWGDWQTIGTGISTQRINFQERQAQGWPIAVGTRDIQTTTSQQTRTGVTSRVVPGTITQTLGDRVVDLSIIPYMRSASVLFTASDFKPSTILYPFFDSTLVETYTARANKFILANNNLNYQTTVGNFENATIKNNVTNTTNGSVVVVKTSNKEIFVVNVSPNTSFNIANANLIGSTTATSVRINGYEHYSGNANAATVSSITLRIDASGANNAGYYANTANSNTIFIVSGTGAGQERTMNSYVAATRTANITSNWTTVPDNTSIYSIGRPTTTAAGDIAGVFTIPASTFRVGEKRFRLIDNISNDVGSSSTNGDASFFAQGLLQRVEETIISATVPTIQRASVTNERVVTSTTVTNQRIEGWIDPLAQTFLIAPGTYPNGLFINRVRFCFKSKDDTVPVTLQIRPTVNGYPSYAVIYPYATVSLTPDKVKITDAPDLDDASKYTDFIFDTPIYMQPGEHSFVLLANSNKYEVYSAEIGALDTVTGRQISEQPYGGSLFLSQNGSTWEPDQNSDMTFRMFRNQFSTTPAIATFKINAPAANTPVDLINLNVGDMVIGGTSLAYRFNSVSNASGGAAGLKALRPLEDYDMNDDVGRRVLTTSNSSFTVQATMATEDPAVSPVIDTTRFGIIAVENIINNLPLANSGFVISNGGTAYANSADVTVTISGGGGSGATATATVTSNVITAITLSDGGSGYTTSPTITITPGSGGGSGAAVTYNGEDKKSGGNADVRYITRRVTLADGFESGDLRVYLTAYKPAGSNILVYYKLLSQSDPDDFDDKNYQLMTEIGNPNFISINSTDYRELTFAPGSEGTANNQISYASGSTSYRSFRTFAIKVVLTGTSFVDVPKVRDFRAIALPEGS